MKSAEHVNKFAQRPLLEFKNRDIEQAFIEFMHPKPLKALLVMFWVGTALFVFQLATEPGSLLELILPWWVCVALAQTFIYVAFTKVPHERKDQLLLFERVLFWATCLFMTVIDHYLILKRFRTCELDGTFIIDERKAYQDPQCRKFIQPLGPIAVFLVLFGILPFTWIVSFSCLSIVYYATVWLAVPPPDLAFQVGMFAVFALLGLVFIAFVRYDQEQGERAAFIEMQTLQGQREELVEREKGLLAYCTMLLPRALLRRSAQLASEGNSDTADNAAIVLIGIHDFGAWCMKQRPLEVATDLVALQVKVRQAADEHSADYIGSMGDTIVCTAGLVRPAPRPGHVACALVHSVLRQYTESLPLRSAVHMGSLRGSFVGGEFHMRYDVAGAAYRVAEEAQLECPPNRCVVSEGLLEDYTAWFEVDGGNQPFQVQKQQFRTVIARPSSPVIVSGNSPENHQHSSDQDIALDLDGVILPALSASQHRQTTADNRIKPEIGDGNPHLDATSDESKGIEVLRAELEKLKRVGTVWCCFPRFEDDAMEEAFVQERMALLPHAASRMWFAYALFVFGILILLLVDLSEPTGVVAVIMLTVAIGLALVMGAVPRTLSRERMQRWFFVWSMTAVVLPLLVLYGTAVARPSAVGNDPMLYMITGALVRSYCFSSTRWLAVTVPITTIVGFGQYALPGAYLRPSVIAVLFLVAATVMAEREREIVHRDSTQRRVESRLALSKLRAVERLREGLVRGAVPKEVFAEAQRLRQAGVTETRTMATIQDGVVMTVSAGHAVEANTPSVGAPLRRLEAMLSASRSELALAGILGDRALVVGPVVVEVSDDRDERGQHALEAALNLSMALVTEHERSGAGGALSVIMDYDTVCHVTVMGDFARYFALGVTVTRLLAILGSADPATLVGCLLTDRVNSLTQQLGLLRSDETSTVGPMKFRGVGMVRFAKVTTVW